MSGPLTGGDESASRLELFDSHTHYQFFDRSLVPDLVNRAIAAGVTRSLCVGSTLASSRAAVEIAETYPGVYAAVGVHPHDASSVTDEVIAELEELARTSSKVKAIGESGLDLYRNLSAREAQEISFRKHLTLADKLGLPVIVHAREANSESLNVVLDHRERTGSLTTGIFHCFSGDAEFAARVIELGFKVSFAGPITYKNAEGLRSVCASVPLEHILIETDAPYLTPHPFRGEQNEPSHIPLIAEKIAEVHGTNIETVAMATTQNAIELLNVS